ncbi:MAG: hypothetical protein ABSA49_08200 [Rhizomicrobium sp.]|jgi:hypothetical protein
MGTLSRPILIGQSMTLFIDSADPREISEPAATGLGVTTSGLAAFLEDARKTRTKPASR